MKIQRIVTLLCTAALLLCAASPPALAADRSAACYYPVEVESYTAGDFDQPRIRKVYQIARRVNSGGGVYPDEVDEITAKLTEASELFGNILEQLSKIK